MSEAREALNELLSDPMIQLVMASDGVTADEIRRLFQARPADEMDGIGKDEEPELPAPYLVASACCCGQAMCA